MSNLEQEKSSQSKEEPDFYQVQQILDKKVTHNGHEYLIKWKNFPNPRDYTWEPLEHLQEVMSLVDEFNNKKEQKIKKETQMRANKTAKKMEEEMEKEETDSYQSLEKPTKKRGRQAKPLYLPKIVKLNAQEEKVKHERKYSQNASQNKQKQRVKDEPNRYLAETTMIPLKQQQSKVQISQKIESQTKGCFHSNAYKLKSIFRHFIQNDKIVYLCNVESNDGDLCSIANLSEQEMASMDIVLQKKYILDLLLEIQKERQKISIENIIQFENYWKTEE